jgi:hypothetical protein
MPDITHKLLSNKEIPKTNQDQPGSMKIGLVVLRHEAKQLSKLKISTLSISFVATIAQLFAGLNDLMKANLLIWKTLRANHEQDLKP